MPDHSQHCFICIDYVQHNIRMLILKDAEHFVGKSLPHKIDISKIKDNFPELIEPPENSPCLRSGYGSPNGHISFIGINVFTKPSSNGANVSKTSLDVLFESFSNFITAIVPIPSIFV